MTNDEINDYIEANFHSHTDLQLAAKLGISPKAVRERRRRMGLRKDGFVSGNESRERMGLPVEDQPSGNTTLEKLLNDNGISFSEVGTIKLSSWSQKPKDDEVVNLDSASITLKVDSKLQDGPAWPVVEPAAPVKVERKKVVKAPSKIKTAVIFPDQQYGFRRDLRTGELDPFHDRKAIAVGMEIARDIEPNLIINLGDLLDFPMFGRYDQEPGFQITTQATLDEAHNDLAEQTEIADLVVEFEGNHDKRLQNYIQKNAMAAFGLTRANAPDEWPVLSVQNLLRLDELGIKYVDGYPNGQYYINERLRCEHGVKVAPRGKIAAKIVADENVSVITGHNHRVESVYRTVSTRQGKRTVVGMTLGCLCRDDGAVPSAKTGLDAFGNPVLGQMDWQQAVGVVEYVEGDGPFNITPVLIHNGTALLDGKLYEA